MTLFALFKQELDEALTQGGVLIPPGEYQAVFTSWREDPVSYCIRLTFVLQNNPGMQFASGVPVDGTDVEAMVWLPKPEDYSTPGKRDASKAQAKLRMAARAFNALGYRAEEHEDLNACLGTPVILRIEHEVYEGEARERVRSIRPVR